MLLYDFEVVSSAHFHYAGTRPMSPHPWLTCLNISCRLKKALLIPVPTSLPEMSALTYIGHYLTLLRARATPRPLTQTAKVFEESFIRLLLCVVGEFCHLPVYFFFTFVPWNFKSDGGEVAGWEMKSHRSSPINPSVSVQWVTALAMRPRVYLPANATVNQPAAAKLITLNVRPDTF